MRSLIRRERVMMSPTEPKVIGMFPESSLEHSQGRCGCCGGCEL